MSIKSWLTERLLGDELAKIRRVNNVLLDAYQYSLTPAGR